MGLPDRGDPGSAGGCSGWIRFMSSGTRCSSKGDRSGRWRKSSGISRLTVRKYVEQAAPVRVEKAPRPRPVWTAVQERLETLLETSPEWTDKKQQLTATRLHALLIDEGKKVGVTLVKEAVAEWKRQRREVYVPLVYRPGELAEVDFFEVAGR